MTRFGNADTGETPGARSGLRHGAGEPRTAQFLGRLRPSHRRDHRPTTSAGWTERCRAGARVAVCARLEHDERRVARGAAGGNGPGGHPDHRCRYLLRSGGDRGRGNVPAIVPGGHRPGDGCGRAANGDAPEDRPGRYNNDGTRPAGLRGRAAPAGSIVRPPRLRETMGSASTIPVLANRRILLGVAGSIAAYKAADLASQLTQAGALVDAVLSEAAQRFVSPLTLASVTGRRAYTDADLWGPDSHVLHVELGVGADVVLVAPATAHTLAKLAAGHADTLLCLAVLAARGPLLLAPAMDAGMFEHPATQANLDVLRGRGAIVLGPAKGRMASGLTGLGRLLEPEDIVGHLRLTLGRAGPLAGRSVIVTAGGTHEPIDPVRVVANRSTGRQGFALAQAALDRGASVTLISGPSTLATPVGA